MPKEQKPMTTVIGVVDGFNRPKEWKEGKNGNFKRCGIKLTGAKTEWINYWWNETSRSGDFLPDPYGSLLKGQQYSFICETSEYNGKTQYDVKSYERLSSGVGAPPPPEPIDEHDEPTPPQEEKIPLDPSLQSPQFKVVGYLIQDQNGTVFEAKG